MLPELLRFRRNVYSQNGEDGILAEILRRLEIKHGWFCEFGAWDGKHLSNTYKLLESGWAGVMIEGDRQRYEDLERTAEHFDGRLHTICRFVTPCAGADSLDSLLAETPIPMDFDVLSIDVDGPDYLIWKSFTRYCPKVVIIEVNSHYPPGVAHVEYGCSFTSMVELGCAKGYMPVVHTGNIFFVRKDFVDQVADGDPKLNCYTNQFMHTSISVQGSLRRWIDCMIEGGLTHFLGPKAEGLKLKHCPSGNIGRLMRSSCATDAAGTFDALRATSCL
jgi:hypothetical protein